VDDLDPIKQLQSLLDDRGKVLEKISGIHSALSSLKNPAPATPAPNIPAFAPSADPHPNLAGEELLYDRLLQTLHDMQSQIEERVRPLAQLTLQAEVAQLREQFAKDQAALKESLARIDQCIASCTDRLDEYQRRYGDLTALNQRLAALGAATEPLPENLVACDVKEIIDLRLQNLSLTGKF
jgi:DNA repair exonuclease SbcCD ATPase subunit